MSFPITRFFRKSRIIFALLLVLSLSMPKSIAQATQNHVNDPATVWNTFLGASNDDQGNAVAVDASGNIYITGDSRSSWGTNIQRTYTSNTDAFVAKLDRSGNPIWNAFLGGTGYDYGNDIAVDGSGNIYVVGYSTVTWGSPVHGFNSGWDIFIAKLDTNGALQWHTFIGSSSVDMGRGIAVDGSGNVYATGASYDNDWGGTPVHAHASPGSGHDAFVAKVDGNTGALAWYTFMGSDSSDFGNAISVDSTGGNIYVAGTSNKTWGSPVSPHTTGLGNDAFAAKLNGSGALQWNTFMGSVDTDTSTDILLDASGANIYVTGYSDQSWGSGSSPLNPHASPANDSQNDAFLAKLATSDGSRAWNTFAGSPGDDSGNALALDGDGYILMAGVSDQTWGSPHNAYTGGDDAFAAQFNAGGALLWNTFLGASSADTGSGIAALGNQAVYLTGTSSTTWGSPINAHAGGEDAFLAQLGGKPEIDVQRPSGTSIGDGQTDDIGYQAVGTVALAYTIDNTAGAADLTIPAGGVTASNYSNSSNFSVGTALPLTIAAGNTETLNISFEIGAVGGFQFDMDIANNDDNEAPYDIRIMGTGVAGEILINEVDADTPGTDSAEFIELYDGGSGNTSLNGLVLVFHNGADDRSYRSFDLDGQTTNANGYFVLCGDSANVANCDYDVSPDTNLLQNGADAVALYMGDATDFPNDTPVTTTNLLDALVYDTDDGDDAGLLVLLNTGQPQINEDGGGSSVSPTVSLQRCANGSGGQRNTNTYGQYSPTPGELNCPPEIDVQRPVSTSIADGGTDAQGTKKSGEEVTLTYTIENQGNSTLNISNITTANETNVNVGTISPVTLNVAGGNTATFNVPYTPTAGSGTFSFELDISSDDSDEANYDITVSGTRDGDAPTVTINQGASQSDPTNTSPIVFDVVFSENVTGFDQSDVNIAGMAGTPTITVTSTGTGNTYTVEVRGMADGETVTATIPANAAQDAAGNDNTASNSTDNQVTYNTSAVAVTINQAATQPDPTNISPIVFDVVFSENVTGFDQSDVTISGMAGTPTITVTSTGTGDTYTVEVRGMADGETITATIPTNAAQDAAGNDNTASTSTDNSVTYDNTAPTVLYGANTIPANNATLTAGPTQIKIEFSENVTTASAEDVSNYLLTEAGANAAFETPSCIAGIAGDDIQITSNAASYDNSNPFITTLDINNGTPLPEGSYRLFICGTTSIEDAVGIHLNNGADSLLDFTVEAGSSPSNGNNASNLPSTGFRHGRVTSLAEQPPAKAYTVTAMTLEIPKLGINIPIVGVPQSADGWDVSWLGNSAGYLAGSAFPTWAGNTVITGHVWDAYNRPGVFAELKSLKYGDQVQIHAWGQTYTYEVRESKLVTKKNLNAAFESEEYDWVTLVTCEFYNPFNGEYLFRRAVRAVLVSVK